MENEGIMSVPMQGMEETDASLYSAAKEIATQQDPQQMQQFSSAVQSGLSAEGMTPEDAQQLLQLVDYIIANAANYPQIRQQLIEQGLADPEDLPEQFNAQFFAALKAGLLEFITSGAGPSMAMAQGGLASLGRFGDTQLAHINPEEAAMLRSMGGRGTINPRTGLPEYFSFKKVLKTAVRVVGTIALTSVGVPLPIASAITTKVTGGSWKEALISGVTAGVGQAVSPFIGDLIGGSLPTALQPYVRDIAQGIFSTGVGLARGQNLGQALRGGIQSGIISAGASSLQNTMNQYEQMGQQEARAAGSPTAGAQAVAPAQAPISNVVTPSDVTATSPGGANMGAPPGGIPDVMPLGSLASEQAAAPTQTGATPITPPVAAAPAIRGPAPIDVAAPEIPGQSATANQPLVGIERLAGMVPGGPQALDYLKSQTPGGIQEAAGPRAEAEAFKAYQRVMNNPAYSNASASTREYFALQAAEAARKAAMPGPLATYGPSVAAGLGLLGATGGFETKPIQQKPPETGFTYYSRDPRRYLLGGLPILYPTAPQTPPPGKANGGIMSLVNGGYPRRTGQISGPGTEKSDDIPAMLSDGEFVLTARAVRGAGKGSRREGAKRLYRLMHMLEKNAPARA